jgi:hypothetical protein
MAGLVVPAIHVFAASSKEDVRARKCLPGTMDAEILLKMISAMTGVAKGPPS